MVVEINRIKGEMLCSYSRTVMEVIWMVFHDHLSFPLLICFHHLQLTYICLTCKTLTHKLLKKWSNIPPFAHTTHSVALYLDSYIWPDLISVADELRWISPLYLLFLSLTDYLDPPLPWCPNFTTHDTHQPRLKFQLIISPFWCSHHLLPKVLVSC